MKQLPLSLLQQLDGVNGFDKEAFLSAHHSIAPTTIRYNPTKGECPRGSEELVPWCGYAVYLSERPVFTLDPAHHAGAYYVQEASSMFLHHMLKSILPGFNGLRVLDLCAAPGGKSTLIASLLGSDSLLISNDVIRSRATILEENMTRWGYMNTWVTSNDPRDFARLPGYFDVIVVDAPCSGSGLWRKDEKAIDEWSEANVQLCAERQQRIIADIWPALKQCGVLVYATCSYSPQEDEEILDWLADTYDIKALTAEVKEEWGIAEVTSARKKMTAYRFFPGRVKGEGFFIAAVQKNDGEGLVHHPRFKTKHDKKIQQQAGYLLKDDNKAFLQTDEGYCAIMPEHEPDFQLLKSALYFRKTGVYIGSPAGKDWIPGHDVALSIDANKNLPCLDLNKEQALKFLKREDPGIADIPKGWLLVTYNGLGLGWVKSLGNRINNHLPKSWRIRMDIPE